MTSKKRNLIIEDEQDISRILKGFVEVITKETVDQLDVNPEWVTVIFDEY